MPKENRLKTNQPEKENRQHKRSESHRKSRIPGRIAEVESLGVKT